MIDASSHDYWLAASKQWPDDWSASAPSGNEVVRILQIPRQGRPKIFPMFANAGSTHRKSYDEVILTYCKHGY